MVKIKVLEKDVQASCLAYLAMRKHFFFRLNNIPVYTNGNFRALGDYTPKGLPDCVVIRNGIFIGLEFKGSSGKLSDDQINVAERIQHSGGQHWLIRSIDDLKELDL